MAMVTVLDDALDKLETVGHGIAAIEDLAKWALADERRDAYEALHTIAVIVDTLRGAFEGKISATDTQEEIAVLKQALVGPDHKFDSGGV